MTIPRLETHRLLLSLIAPADAPSIRVAERLGMRRRGEIDLRGRPVTVFALSRWR